MGSFLAVRRTGLVVTVALMAGAALGAMRAQAAAPSRPQATLRADGASTPQPRGPAARTGLDAVPVAAQGVVSARLGQDDARYHVRRAGAALRAVNTRQGFTATFDPDGLDVQAGAWRWGMRVDSMARGTGRASVGPTAPRAAGNRVEYRHAALAEWYVNGPMGLEQGFTVTAAPPGDGPLAITLALSGAVAEQTGTDRGTVTLRPAAADGPALRYGGVAASDAAGRALPAWVEASGRAMTLHVDTRGAQYPVAIDPFLQSATLTASNAVSGDYFGYSVAVSGDTVVVGVPNKNALTGAAYVFVKAADGWTSATETAELTASDGQAYDYFGWSVAVSGDTVVVGAPFKGGYAGAAYVFVKPGGGWTSGTQTAELTASDGVSGDNLGYAVAVSGDTAVVGAPLKNGYTGATYVFAKPGGGWTSGTETAELTASDGESGDYLGYSVAVSGNAAVAGAPFKNGYTGVAYVFVEPGAGWASGTETAELTASDTPAGGEFGWSVGMSGDTAAVGAVGAYSTRGVAYVFVKPDSGWIAGTETAQLTASDGASGDQFGWSVGVSGDTVIVGTPSAYNDAGTAYVYVKPTSGWASGTETTELTDFHGRSADYFGYAVAVDADTAVVGATYANNNTGTAFVFVSKVLAATTSDATNPTASGATLNGTVTPAGPTMGCFQWGPTTAYGNTTACQSIGSGTGSVPITADLSGLAGGTTFHYRTVASSPAGTAYGDDVFFTTSAASSDPGQIQTLQDELASANATIQTLQGQVTALTQQKAALQAQVVALDARIDGLRAALDVGLAVVRQTLAQALGQPAFRIAGAGPAEQFANLVRAIVDLTRAQKQALGKNLGGE